MNIHRRASCLTLSVLLLLLPVVANAQPPGAGSVTEKRSVSEGAPSLRSEVGSQSTVKRSSRVPAEPNSQDASREKPQGGVAKTESENLRARDQGNDYWTTCFGGFHLFGNDARAVYRYPAQPTGTGYDTHWTFVDDFPVGGRTGWTYKEDGFNFYMFFAQNADSNGKFWIAYSFDNSTFHFYAWAD